MFRALAALALFAAAPAAAVTYDAFTSFNALQGSGGFIYGGTDFTTFTPFGVTGSCAIGGTICLSNLPGQYFGAYKATVAHTSTTINVPDDRLILHPGPGTGAATFVGFQVTTAGLHTYSAEFNQQDTNTAAASVNLTEFYLPFGGAAQLYPIAQINQGNPSLITGFSDNFNVGDLFGYIIDNDGDFQFDSTGVNFTVDAPASAVPEPATWALLIGGFGLTGATLRRRRALAV